MIYHEADRYSLYNGNSLDVLKQFDDNSVDSIVTDPPYGLAFMNAKWDYDVPSVDMWQECLRVLKPGGHLLAFSGARTYHRLVVNIEDAGFDIRDMIAWIYGSGFPKSHNIGKAIDKLQGNERKSIGLSLNRRKSHGKDGGISFQSSKNSNMYEETVGFSDFEGWGTALKPAIEPIVLARKPISEKTIAENVIKHGTGGINIDNCRIEIDENEILPNKIERSPKTAGIYGAFTDKHGKITWTEHIKGRFPANVIHDGSDEVIDLFPQQDGVIGQKRLTGQKSIFNLDEQKEKQTHLPGIKDSGSAARFFYCAKASRKERDMGLSNMTPQIRSDRKNIDSIGADNPRNRSSTPKRNHHPTVKPLKLMRYLCKLITPKRGLILDPFMGSGSTGIAALQEGFRFIGIDLEEDYCEIARLRIDAGNPTKI